MENQSIYKEEMEVRMATAFPALMRKVYNWMALALVVTGLTAYYVANSQTLLEAIVGNSILFYGLIIAELGLVWYLSARIMKISFATAGIMFTIYSILNGITMSFIFLVYTSSSIATVFFITAGMFAAMSLVGYFTKADLTGFGKFLLMALIGLIIATVVNMFLKSGTMSLIISYIGVLIFVGLTAYDTQKIKNMLMLHGHEVNDETQKLALMGSLSLYLDFINLFLYLLRIFGGRR